MVGHIRTVAAKVGMLEHFHYADRGAKPGANGNRKPWVAHITCANHVFPMEAFILSFFSQHKTPRTNIGVATF